jgi:hypothetical protein
MAWVTAMTSNTLVAKTACSSSRDTTLGRVDLANSSTDMPGSRHVCEMAALLTSTSRRPSSLRMRSAAATMEFSSGPYFSIPKSVCCRSKLQTGRSGFGREGTAVTRKRGADMDQFEPLDWR